MKTVHLSWRFANKNLLSKSIFLVFLSACTSASVQKTPAVDDKELYFAPPPMPKFMLAKPDKPITPEEMARQIKEAKAQSQLTKPPTNP